MSPHEQGPVLFIFPPSAAHRVWHVIKCSVKLVQSINMCGCQASVSSPPPSCPVRRVPPPCLTSYAHHPLPSKNPPASLLPPTIHPPCVYQGCFLSKVRASYSAPYITFTDSHCPQANSNYSVHLMSQSQTNLFGLMFHCVLFFPVPYRSTAINVLDYPSSGPPLPPPCLRLAMLST